MHNSPIIHKVPTVLCTVHSENVAKSAEARSDQGFQTSIKNQKSAIAPANYHCTSENSTHGPAPYYQEWRDSCVAPEIIKANVRCVEGDEAVDQLTAEAIGKMGGWAQQYATAKVTRLRKRYKHVEAGGWWVNGLDPLNNWAPMNWGQLKPHCPRERFKRCDDGTYEATGDRIKYEAPAGTATRAIFLAGAVDWATVQSDASIPRLWTEGAKKAGAALTAGYAAIALPGIYSGYRSKDTLGNPIAPCLIPEVAAMAQAGGVHYLVFDQDEKTKTRRNVAIALSRFGQLLQAQGCTVKIVRWSAKQGKGLDDLIAKHGADAFHTAVDQALTLDEFELWQALENRLKTAPSVVMKASDLTTLQPESVPDSGVIAIASAKGTGKTKLIGGLIEDQNKALLAGHRICLMRNLSERCGVSYRGDLDKQEGRFIAGDAYTFRVGTCVDSLLAINPAVFRGCDLVLDEIVQVLRHLLTSSTCNKQGKRPVLLMRFRELLQAARRVIIADADLDDKAIAYIQQLRGDSGRPFLIRNDYKAPGYPVRFIEASDASAITGEILRDLQAGDRIYIATDSRRGSKRLARLIEELKHQIPNLLINSETSGGSIEQAFMESPDQYLTEQPQQAVIASPSAGTGISVEGGHFDKVYGLFYGGSITDADMAQALGRVRANVPRVVWCAKHGSGFSRAGRETRSLKLLDLLRQKSDANTLLIRSSLSELTSATSHDSSDRTHQPQTFSGMAAASGIGYDWAEDPHVHYWAKIEAERNRSMWNLRTALKVRLMHEGHQLDVVQMGTDGAAKLLLKAAREKLKTEHAIAVEAAENLRPAEAKALEQLDGLDESQRLALKKWQLADFYCLPVDAVDADLVLWDNDGRRRGQLLNLEGFMHPDTATGADVRSLENQTQWQKGYTPWDLSNAALKSELRHQLNLDAYLQTGQQWSSESLAEFKTQALQWAAPIKAALNFSVREDMPAAQILNQLLEQMGVECIGKQQRKDGERIRTYQIDPLTQQLNVEILERRKARRKRLREGVTPPSSICIESGGCDRQKAPEIEVSAAAGSAAVDVADFSEPDEQQAELPLNIRPDYYNSSAWGWSA